MPLLPFVVMLIVHRLLGLSDAMLAAPKPGETFWPLYNILMILAFYAGVAGYLTHAFWVSNRGLIWVVAKCIALVVAWTGMILILAHP